jgi:hypothetical protein
MSFHTNKIVQQLILSNTKNLINKLIRYKAGEVGSLTDLGIFNSCTCTP